MELSSIIKRLEYGVINMNTDFQRKSGLWTKVQKSQLIESLLLRIPIPAFYFDGRVKDNWLIIDGLQRITALKEFVVDGIRHALYQEPATELCKRFADFHEFKTATTYIMQEYALYSSFYTVGTQFRKGSIYIRCRKRD